MQKEFSISQAKNNFSAMIHDAEDGSPVTLTRRGKPVAVLLSIREYERLNQKESAPSEVQAEAPGHAPDNQGVGISDSDSKGLGVSFPGPGPEDKNKDVL